MSYLLLLQNIRLASASVLDAFMLSVSKLGESLITFLLLAFVYWCVNKRTGQLMAMHVGLACWTNQWMKKIFRIERPWVRDALIQPVPDAIPGAGGYSMPSGHTSRAMAAWGSVAYAAGKNCRDTVGEPKEQQRRREQKWLSVCCWLAVGLVMFSRNYLGVHTFADVLVAFLMGLLYVVAIDYLLTLVDRSEKKQLDIAICIVGCILLLLPMLRYGCLSNAGAGYGFLIGWVLERRFVRFSVYPEGKLSFKRRILRFIPGGAVLYLCFTSGTTLLTHVVPSKYAGFFLQGFAAFFIIFLYPMLIKIWEDSSYSSAQRKHYKRMVAYVLVGIMVLGTVVCGVRIKSHYGEFANPEQALTTKEQVDNEQLQNATEEAATDLQDTSDDQNVSENMTAETEPEEHYSKLDDLSDRVQIIAHRGYSGVAPENTMAAFERAIDIKADYIELDVQLTKDDVLVVFHDTELDRITGQAGEVGDYTYEELTALDVGSWFTAANTGMTADGMQRNYAGQRIPTLQEVLEFVRESNTDIYLELKDISASLTLTDEQKEAFPGKVVDAVNGCGMTDRVLYASFRYEYLQQIKTLDENYKILCNTSIGDADRLLREFPAEYYGINADVLQQDTIEALKEAGASVYVWTVNTPSRMRQVIRLGADGIVTNEPGIATVVVQERYRYLADNYISSVTIPGIYDESMSDRTVTHIDEYGAKISENQEVPAYTPYVVQGFTKAGNHLVVSAYDASGEHNSILYIMTTTGRLETIIDLGFQAHTGGIAYDEKHDLLWVTGANGYVNGICWSSVIGGTYRGSGEEILVSFDAGLVNHNDSHVASFLAYNNNKLYVGSYCKEITGKLNEYDLTDPLNPVMLKQCVIPEKIQGITFAYDAASGEQTLLLTQGADIQDGSLLSVRWDEERLDYSQVDREEILPEGPEQPLMTADGLYILFESSARVYRYNGRCVSDRIWLVNYQ